MNKNYKIPYGLKVVRCFTLLLALGCVVIGTALANQKAPHRLLHPGEVKVNLMEGAQWLSDPSKGKLTIARALENTQDWHLFDAPYQSRLLPGQTHYWVRVRLYATPEIQNIPWLLGANLYADSVDFYLFDEAGSLVSHFQTGAAIPPKKRDNQVNYNKAMYVPLAMVEGQQSLYVRLVFDKMIAREMGRLTLTLFQAPHLSELLTQEAFMQGNIAGMYIIVVLFNLALLMYHRDVVQGLFLVNIIFSALFFFSLNGFFLDTFQHPFVIHLSRYFDYVFAGMGMLTFLFFLYHYLNIPQLLPAYKWSFKLLIVAITITVLVGLFAEYRFMNNLEHLWAGGIIVLMLVTGVHAWKKQYKPAAFLLLASAVSVAGLSMFILSNMFLQSYFSLGKYTLHIGEAVRAVAFAMGIYVRYGLIEKKLSAKMVEQERMQKEHEQQLNLLLEGQNKLLENKVQKRTQELEQQKQVLEETNRVKDKLFSIISHDLRGPMSSVHSLMRLISMGAMGQEQLKLLAVEIEDKVKVTLSMIDNLLHWARSQMGGLTARTVPVEIHALTEGIGQLFATSLKQKNLQLLNKVGVADMVLADREMMALVLRNLVANAIKFSYPGGEITVATRHEGQHLILCVTDEGIGIEKERLEKIFSPQYHSTTLGTQQERGTGLGLVLCQEFIEKNHGRIWAESSIGKGTTFFVAIPALVKELN